MKRLSPLQTPLGALSVVVCAILSHFFLNESLTTFGSIGCALCIVRVPCHWLTSRLLTSLQVGSVVIALNGPKEESIGQIEEFQKLFLAPGFLAFTGVVILASLGIIIFVAPKWVPRLGLLSFHLSDSNRYGDKSMLWYISICSMIGGLSVSCTSGLGAAIVTSVMGDNQVGLCTFPTY